jgi:hypothetical protein
MSDYQLLSTTPLLGFETVAITSSALTGFLTRMLTFSFYLLRVHLSSDFTHCSITSV